MAETIREFLVALGFHVDENSFSKFETRLGRATAGAVELGEVVIATATAIEVAVAKMALQFENLFYESQRTGSAVRAIQGFEYAARTVGVTSDSARGAVEGLARAMRSNPGIGALLNQLGVRTQGRGSAEILTDVIGQLKKLPFYLAQQYGQQLGIDGDTLLMLIQRYDELRKAQEDYDRRQKAAGVDAQKLAGDSRTFENALRSLETTLALIADRILQDFIGPVTKAVVVLDQWGRQFIELDKATNGWATTLATVGTTALATWIGKLLLAKLLFRSAVADAGAAAAAGGGAAAAGGGAAAAGAGGAASAAGAGWLARLGAGAVGATGLLAAGIAALPLIKHDQQNGNVIRDWLRKQLGIPGENETPSETGGAPVPTGKKGNAADMIQYFVSQGWTPEQATGIVANLQSESALNPRSVGDGGQAYGLAQWHRERQNNFSTVFGHDIRSSTLEEQLQFVQYELTRGAEQAAGAAIRQAGGPEAAAAATSRFYERPADASGEASRRSTLAREWWNSQAITRSQPNGANVTINSKTDVHVSSTDPKQAGREVQSNQNAVNANIVRYAGENVR